MPVYAYEAIREPGEVLRGELEAADPLLASAALLRRGYHVLSLKDTATTRHRPARLGGLGGLRQRDFVRFTRDLASLLKAGLPLASALRTLREREPAPAWQGIFTGLRVRLEDGQTFSHALQAYPMVFDAVYVNLIRAGEEGGNLPEILLRLAAFAGQREEIHTRTRMAVVYPAVLLLLGLVAVVMMMTLVVPRFTEVLQETGQALPWPTAVLIALSGFFSTWWWALLPASIAAGLALRHAMRSATGKTVRDKALIRLPLFGDLVKKNQAGLFARTLGALLENGVPLVQALQITAGTQGNVLYQEAVRGLVKQVRDGQVLSRALERCPLFVRAMPSIIAVAEQSGNLPGALHQIADEQEQDTARHVRLLLTLLEPAMIVFVGALVGFIVLAMLLPIFSLGDSLQL
jgi:type II secretory pathway component PulF